MKAELGSNKLNVNQLSYNILLLTLHIFRHSIANHQAAQSRCYLCDACLTNDTRMANRKLISR